MLMNHLIDAIGDAITMTGRIVAGVRADQWDAPSPCDGWTVRDVVNHTVGGMEIFAAELTGGAAGDHAADWLGVDPAAAYATAAANDRAAWAQPDGLSRTITISLGALPGPMAAAVHLTELLGHGCDIAVATGQEHLLDEASVEGLLAMMAQMGGIDAFRLPGIFGPAVAVPDDAPAHLRLLGYLGRTYAALGARA